MTKAISPPTCFQTPPPPHGRACGSLPPPLLPLDSGQISTGHLVNLTTTDVERFQFCGCFVNYLWGAPLESLVILYFGLNLVGVSFLAGFAALALMVPTQVRRAYGTLFDRAFVSASPEGPSGLASTVLVRLGPRWVVMCMYSLAVPPILGIFCLRSVHLAPVLGTDHTPAYTPNRQCFRASSRRCGNA